MSYPLILLFKISIKLLLMGNLLNWRKKFRKGLFLFKGNCYRKVIILLLFGIGIGMIMMGVDLLVLLMLILNSIYILSSSLIMLTEFSLSSTNPTSKQKCAYQYSARALGKKSSQTNTQASTWNPSTNNNTSKTFKPQTKKSSNNSFTNTKVVWQSSPKQNFSHVIYLHLLQVHMKN